MLNVRSLVATLTGAVNANRQRLFADGRICFTSSHLFITLRKVAELEFLHIFSNISNSALMASKSLHFAKSLLGGNINKAFCIFSRFIFSFLNGNEKIFYRGIIVSINIFKLSLDKLMSVESIHLNSFL